MVLIKTVSCRLSFLKEEEKIPNAFIPVQVSTRAGNCGSYGGISDDILWKENLIECKYEMLSPEQLCPLQGLGQCLHLSLAFAREESERGNQGSAGGAPQLWKPLAPP